VENKESIKQYRLDNIDKIKDYHKEYNVEHREQISQQKKEYRERNKEKRKEKYTCVCGSNLLKIDIRRHEKSKKHKNYVEEIETNGDPRQLNEFFDQIKFKVSI
jgi:hypothetical protein